MSRSCARQWRASFSPQDAVVRGGDEVGKVSTLLLSPLLFHSSEDTRNDDLYGAHEK